jgi:uncharacterized membrane protein
MLEMLILGAIIVLAAFFFIFWVESILNDNNEFIEIEEWEQFQQSMKKGKK